MKKPDKCTCGIYPCVHTHNNNGARQFVTDCEFNRLHYPHLIWTEYYGDGPWVDYEYGSPYGEEFYKKYPHFKAHGDK